jgi:MFS family permease
MVMAFTVGSMIASHGWRAGYFTVAVPGLLIVVPLLLIFVRTRPVGAASQSVAERADALPGYEVREALRTRTFWMLVVAQLSYGLAVGGTFHHLVAFLEGLSYSLHSATLVVEYRARHGSGRKGRDGRVGRPYRRQKRACDRFRNDRGWGVHPT